MLFQVTAAATALSINYRIEYELIETSLISSASYCNFGGWSFVWGDKWWRDWILDPCDGVTPQLGGIEYGWYGSAPANNSTRRAKQARNQLGTPPGAKSFLRGTQIFWTTSSSSKLYPTHFSRGGKFFLGGASPPLRLPWLRAWCQEGLSPMLIQMGVRWSNVAPLENC